MPLDFSSVGAVPVKPAAPASAPASGSLDFSSVGAVPTSTATTAPPPPTPSITDNPNKEGTYQLFDSKGQTAHVPYSMVPAAREQGYRFARLGDGPEKQRAGSAEEGRFIKDRFYDPNNSHGQAPSSGSPGGFVKSAVSTATGAAHLLDKATKPFVGPKLPSDLNDLVTYQKPADNPDDGFEAHVRRIAESIAPGSTQPLSGVKEHLTAGVEQAGEFAYGAGEWRKMTEGLELAEKLPLVQKTLKFLAEHPNAERYAKVGAKAATTGTEGAVVGTAQAAAHGADAKEALEAGAMAGAGGALTELVPGAITAKRANVAADALKPGAEEVLAARTAEMNAGRQATAQQGVKDVAKSATQDAIARYNEARAPLAITGEPVNPEIDFKPVDAKAATADLNSFGDGGEKLREIAKPDYEAIDKATGGKFNELQGDLAKAYRAHDSAAIDATDKAIDKLLKDAPGVDENTRAGAASAWRDSKIFDKLHAATEGAFNGISEEMAAQPGTSSRLLKSGNSDGGSLQKRIGTLMSKPKMAADVTRLIGSDGVANLYRASHLVSTPELKAATATLAEEVAKQFPKDSEIAQMFKRVRSDAIGTAVSAAIGHAAGIPQVYAAPAGGVLTEGGRWVMNKMVSSPRVGQLMEWAVTHGVTPKIAAGLVANAIATEQGVDRMEQPKDDAPQ